MGPDHGESLPSTAAMYAREVPPLTRLLRALLSRLFPAPDLYAIMQAE